MMGGEYPTDRLDSKGLPRGLSDEDWSDDGLPAKKQKKASKPPASVKPVKAK